MTITDSARRLALVAVVAMLAALLPLGGALAQDDPDPGDGDRQAIDLDGSTNVQYSIRWSQVTYPNAAVDAGDGPTEALIARDDVFADSLASGPLQGADDAGRPLLLTPSNELSADTAAELERLGVDSVTVLGNEDAVSQDVIDDLEADYTVNRLGGETRIETAIAVAETVDSDTAILARGFANDDPTQAFADTLAAGGWAAEDDVPVLFTQTEVLTGNTRDHIADAGYSNIIIVGGDLAVSGDVETELTDMGVTVERVAGDNRFETAVAIAEARGYSNPDDAEGVILVDGQGEDAWADGFPAANLSAQGYPIVLSNSADESLPDATVEYLDRSTEGDAGTAQFAAHLTNVVLICGSTVPDGDDGSASDQCGEAAALLGATVTDFEPPAQPGDVTIDPSTIGQGGGTITISGLGDATEVFVSGCGLTGTDQNQAGNVNEDGELAITVGPQAAGSSTCTLTVTVDGEELTFEITVQGAQPNQTVTAAPELTSCTIEAGRSAQNPANGIVRYTFDEAVTGQAPVPGNFHIFRFTGQQFNGAVARTSGSEVFVEFPASQLANTTVCTVDFAAVRDVTGLGNPEGDAAVQSVLQAAGITEAPDLSTVGNFRGNVQGTLVYADYTFDENVANTVDPTRFQLLLTDGSLFTGNGAFNCDTTPPGSTPFAPPRMCVTIQFPFSQAQIPFSQISRGIVFEDTVFDESGAAAGGPFGNPLQTADVTNSGNTAEPDLVSASVLSSTQVEYIFDQPVTAVNVPAGCVTGAPGCSAAPQPQNFGIYDANGDYDRGDQAARSQTNPNAVIVTFNAGTPAGRGATAQQIPVTNAVGAFIFQGAAYQSENPNLVRFNDDDEVALQQVGFTAGRTQLPDLVSVSIFVDQVTQQRVVRYTFDASVANLTDQDATAAGANGEFGTTDFQLYDANGTRFIPVVSGNPQTGPAGSNADVRRVSGDANSVDVFTFTNAQADAAVLGTVDDFSAGQPPVAQPIVPEGAEVVEGRGTTA